MTREVYISIAHNPHRQPKVFHHVLIEQLRGASVGCCNENIILGETFNHPMIEDILFTLGNTKIKFIETDTHDLYDW